MRNAATQGYTLLQVTIVMVVICVTTAIGLPAFRELLVNQRLATTAHRLSSQFALARSSAISSGVPVSACPSRGDGNCRSDSDWSQGWIVFRDPQRRGEPSEAASILTQETAPAANSVVLLSNQGRRAIRFLPDGRSSGSNLTVRICERGRLRATVVVNNAGRVRSAKVKGQALCRRPE
ncbi:GspH/FimT family pseudopilin [Xanthomonas theicola]|uniref:Type II secretion system protein H n=1 Tax=Xanthomonas theicola TaxID=56464 RepID=A0A2S6Z803_9XANT|nr:GspH/FimT family pseudopilin [Xanthomonas theicola]PPT77696.1 pilus assembly protein [Xanthomonas theicola]QNH25102.1 pilus assembly protein [Xanthomonas theicola]